MANLTPEQITAIEDMKKRVGQPYDCRVVDAMDFNGVPPCVPADLRPKPEKGK